ncbi:urea ABC transporter ATP-binding protein UrtD [Labrys sp. WJW]|uniref:urea ABC transporter ATP-binding protein UrtD n=1 Tax=Labrys sp. WJW TaxID=1737983 RepID=UPI0008337823|nr:urea ABC transporter ATP-binding protein UrtD [Labrys sp. WJW]OCC03596.1 urea ABC transporter ATP-binding protein UrtD [Labrys sp. WJW]
MNAVTRIQAARPQAATPPILTTRQLTVRFDDFPAVSNVDLSIEDGELRVIIGANGAGKSTLLDLLCGKVLPSEGEIWLRDRNITGIGEAAIARSGVGRKFQTPAVFKEMTVLENLQIASNRYVKVRDNLFRRFSRGPSDRELAVAERTGLSSFIKRKAGELSHGQLQWLELAMVLSQDPKVILLDEPAAGMTAAETDKTAELLLALAGEHTVLVIEHDMAFVRRICRTITVLHQGSVLAEGTADDIEKNPAVIEAYLGSATLSHA